MLSFLILNLKSHIKFSEINKNTEATTALKGEN